MSSRILLIVSAALIATAFVVWRIQAPSDPVAPATQVSTERQERSPVAIDARRQQLAGVRLERVKRGTLEPNISGVGVVQYNRALLTDVSVRVEGWIREVYVHGAGERVGRNQELFSLESPELISLQVQLLSALRNRDLVPDTTPTQPQYAERLVETPRERLIRAGVPDDQLRLLEEQRQVLPALVFRSPAPGVVIESFAVRGMHVAVGETLYRLADLRAVWLDSEFPESALPSLAVGGRAVARLAAWPGREFVGKVISISPAVKESGRTVTVRIELTNPDARLKPGMLASVALGIGKREGLLVPEDAVVDSGTRQIVFVAQSGGYFEPRDVTLGGRADGRVLLLTGIREDEEVVTRGAFLIDSESRMSASLQNYQVSPSSGRAETTLPGDGFDVSIHVEPDPPETGENSVEVRIRDRNGLPTTDLDVRLLCLMPAMPAMNMPEMRSESRLRHVQDGLYRGEAALSMAGRWEVTVNASREGAAIATARTVFMAR